MKPKILLVKYSDWAVLAGLVLLLLVAMVRAFLIKDTTVRELSDEIARHDRTIQEAMRAKGPPRPLVRRDLVTEFRNRFERPSVISDYMDNPFFPEKGVATRAPVLLKKGQTIERAFKGIRFVEIVQVAKEIVDVSFEYDSEERMSIVRFEGRAEGSATVRLRTIEDRVHNFMVIVQEKPTFTAPRPPIDVAIDRRARHEGDGVERPPRVLITFLDDNPKISTEEVGYATGAHIYRKASGAPDVEYIRLTREPLTPATREQIDEIWEWFYIRERRAAAGGERPSASGAMPRSRAYEPEVPPTYDEFRRFRTPGSLGQVGARPRTGTYIFVDTAVDEGESYVYRIVTISAVPDAEPVACKRPFVTRTPVVVPSFVTVNVISASLMRASVYVTRPDPETRQRITERFSIIPGMKLGGIRRIRRRETVVFVPGARDTVVDFSTGHVLVDSLPFMRRVEYRVHFDRRKNKFTYTVRKASDPRILYVTSHGSLRWKAKNEPLVPGGRDFRGSLGTRGSPRRRPREPGFLAR